MWTLHHHNYTLYNPDEHPSKWSIAVLALRTLTRNAIAIIRNILRDPVSGIRLIPPFTLTNFGAVLDFLKSMGPDAEPDDTWQNDIADMTQYLELAARKWKPARYFLPHLCFPYTLLSVASSLFHHSLLEFLCILKPHTDMLIPQINRH